MNNSSCASTHRGGLSRVALTLPGLLLGSLVASCNSSDSGGQATTYMVGGTVIGLSGTVVLQNNGGDDLSLTTNGAFTFKTPLASGSAYSVTVKTQPSSPAQSCSVTNGSGTVGSASVSNVGIACTTRTFPVGGSVSGLTASGLVLENNGRDDLSVTANSTSFQFANAVASGAMYAVSVKTQPTGQTCSVTSASGTVGNGPITSVAVTCTTNSHPVACGQENGTVINHTGNITADETWVGQGTVHLVANSINVLAPATLTVAPCAIVKLKAGVEIVIKGDATGTGVASLVSAGTDATDNFVTFTSADPQGWARLRGFNANSHIELDYSLIRNGGNAGGQQRNAVVAMTGSGVLPDPVLKVNTVNIQGSGTNAGSGIYLSDAAFTADSQLLSVGGFPYPIALTAMAAGSIPPNTSFNVDTEEVLIVENANIFDNLTISTTLPIHFQSGVHVGGLAPNFVPNVTLTLEAGVTLKFESQPATPSMVTFGDLGQTPNKNAALVAHGTEQQPVIFTSGAASPAPGDWAGLWLATSAGSQLDHVVIEYAGADAAIGPQNCGPIVGTQRARNTGALFVGDNDPNQYVPPSTLITNSEFRNNSGNYAIDAVWTSAAFGPDLTAGNTFGAGPQLCKQGKNLIVGGCVVNHVDESGCLVQ